MEIIFSADPDAPRATAGVAFVINKTLIAPRNTHVHEIRPGRVLLLNIEWLDEEETSLMNIYAPNERVAHQPLWTEIDDIRRARGLPAPNFLLGDFNVTKNAIDRMPPHLDDQNATEALREIRQLWGVSDAWRIMYPSN